MWNSPFARLALLAVSVAVSVLGQTKVPEEANTDMLGRSTPRGTVVGFLEAAHKNNFSLAVQYLDTGDKGAPAQELARQLQTVLDAAFITDLDRISDQPLGKLDSGLPAGRQRAGFIANSKGTLPVLLQRVERPDSGYVWLFSTDTLRHIPQMYREVAVSAFERKLPDVFVDARFLSMRLWQWIALFLTLPISFLLSSLLARLLILPIRVDLRTVTRPARLLTVALCIMAAVHLIGVPVLARQYWIRFGIVLTVIAVAWLVSGLIDGLAVLAQRRLLRTGEVAGTAALQLGRRVAKIVVVLVAGLLLLQGVGVNLSPILAGVGVGGIAIALAAQKTIENLFGGLMILSDRPVRVGDVCRFGDKIGTVEDIGIRSTRLRTPDRTLVAVPNGQFAAMSLENFSAREKIWFNHKVGVRGDSTPEQLRKVLTAIDEMLHAHPMVEDATARVRFVEIGDSSYNLQIFAYVLTSDYVRFLEVQEELLLRILGILEEAGTASALPSQTLYLKRDRIQ